MRHALIAALTLAVACSLASGSRAQERLQVVELFTSQGCSSCPPADALLGRLAQEEDVLALSFSVDYWDYLSWTDTLAHPAFTARQKGYAKARGDRAVYTPQAVVNGTMHVVGSREDVLRKAMAETAAPDDAPRLKATRTGDRIVVRAEPASGGTGRNERRGVLWLVVFSPRETVKIGEGENAGRTVTYHNVVRRLEKIDDWHGKPVSVTVRLPQAEARNSAVLLQAGSEKKPGPVLAAARP